MKRSELRQIIREEYAKIVKPQPARTKLTESEVSKELDSAAGGYQQLLKQKQDLIQAIKTALSTIKDPQKKQETIAKHNTAIKKVNKQIEAAEKKFIKAVDNIEAAEEDDLL